MTRHTRDDDFETAMDVANHALAKAFDTRNGAAHDGKDVVDDDLTKMNNDYAVVKVGGKTRVMFMKESLAHPGCKLPEYSTIGDFCAFHANPKKGPERKVGIGRWWIDQPERRQYDGIVYAPGACPIGKLNLWGGFSCEPSDAGDCSLYLAHLTDNICSSNPDHSQYLLDWMADAVQNPGRQGETAVIMRGKEGVGKGVAAKYFGRLFGPHYVHISQASHLTGHFNAHLQQCSVLFADEAFFAGDRSHEGILKALITEDTLMIECKGLDAFAVRNCLHLIMSSNSDWVIPAGADARRYFVLTVSDDHKQDVPYFTAIAAQMDNGGLAALLYHLLNRDLSRFNIRDIPQTDALADQKAFSRRGLDRVVESMAHDGMLLAAHMALPNVAVTTGEEEGTGFYSAAKKLAPDLKHVSSIVIKRALKNDWGCTDWHVGNLRGLTFPPLRELRETFDKKHGKQDWPIDAKGNVRDWGNADA